MYYCTNLAALIILYKCIIIILISRILVITLIIIIVTINIAVIKINIGYSNSRRRASYFFFSIITISFLKFILHVYTINIILLLEKS